MDMQDKVGWGWVEEEEFTLVSVFPQDLDKKEGMEEVVETSGKIRITLTSCNVQSLEKGEERE